MKASDAKRLLMRSLLFVPGHMDRFFESALRSDADALVLDLEDSVPERLKDAARDRIIEMLERAGDRFSVFVRVNSAESGRMEGDIHAIVHEKLAGVVLSKARGPRDVRYLGACLTEREGVCGLSEQPCCILPLVENCMAVMAVDGLVSGLERVVGLVFGHEDFLADLQAPGTKDERDLFVPRALVAIAARAVGGVAIDTPYLQLDDVDGCEQRARKSRELGFSGMLVLHPRQVEVANRAFSPTLEEVAEARKALEQAGQADSNQSISFKDGRFTAPPVLLRARWMVELYRRIMAKVGK